MLATVPPRVQATTVAVAIQAVAAGFRSGQWEQVDDDKLPLLLALRAMNSACTCCGHWPVRAERWEFRGRYRLLTEVEDRVVCPVCGHSERVIL